MFASLERVENGGIHGGALELRFLASASGGFDRILSIFKTSSG
jgi:hypothetical protein